MSRRLHPSSPQFRERRRERIARLVERRARQDRYEEHLSSRIAASSGVLDVLDDLSVD